MAKMLNYIDINGLDESVRYIRGCEMSETEYESFKSDDQRLSCIKSMLFRDFQNMLNNKKGLFNITRSVNSDIVRFDTDLVLMTTEELMQLIKYVVESK